MPYIRWPVKKTIAEAELDCTSVNNVQDPFQLAMLIIRGEDFKVVFQYG